MQVNGDDQCIRLFNDVDGYTSLNTALAGGDILAHRVNALYWNLVSTIIFYAKWSLGELIKQLKRVNTLKIEKDEFATFEVISYEIIDEIVARQRLEVTDSVKEMARQKFTFDTISIRKQWPELFFKLMPVCREMVHMLKIAVNAYEMRINRIPFTDLKLTATLDSIKKKLENKVSLKRLEIRKLNGDIKVLEPEIALKYYAFEMDLRKKANWRVLFDTAVSEMEKVDALTKDSDSDAISNHWAVFKGKFEELEHNFHKQTFAPYHTHIEPSLMSETQIIPPA